MTDLITPMAALATSPRETTPGVPFRPALSADPVVLVLADELIGASAAVREVVATTDAPGLARRLMKLSRQLAAAARLLRRGRGLTAPAVAGSAHHLARRAVASSPELADVDAIIRTMSSVIVALHDWRGHTASVPTP